MRLPWDQYQLVLFDFDDTLVDFAASEGGAVSAVCSHYGREATPERLAQFKAINRALWQRHDAGEIPSTVVFIERFKQFLLALEVEGVADEANQVFLDGLVTHVTPFPQVGELMAFVAGRAKVGIVSNGHGVTQRRRAEAAGFAQHIHFYAISQEVGVAKPHPTIFAEAYRLSGLPPGAKTLMVGDNVAADIDGARAAGFDTCWIHNGQRGDRAVESTYAFASLAAAFLSHP
jgi:FMN phosphatase YigB (HAD superfamily)